jgi:hypothetical protein
MIVVANIMMLDGYRKLKGDEDKPCSALDPRSKCAKIVGINTTFLINNIMRVLHCY